MGHTNPDKPRRESIDFFEKAMRHHDKVLDVNKEGEQVYTISRVKGSPIKLYLTNLYTVGITDYFDIIERYNDINAILTISNWNGYTKQAKEEAKKNGVGIYVVEEFMGALNLNDPTSYIKRDSKGKPIHFGTR